MGLHTQIDYEFKGLVAKIAIGGDYTTMLLLLEHPSEVAKLKKKKKKSQFSKRFSKIVATTKQLNLKRFNFELAARYSSKLKTKNNILM